jgi:hypothetical protein
VDLWVAVGRKSTKSSLVEFFCQRKSLPCLCYGRYDGVAGIAEFPRKYREWEDGLDHIVQGSIHPQARTAQLIEVVSFLEERIVRGEKAFHNLLRRLLTVKQRVFNEMNGGEASKSIRAPRRSSAAFLSQPLTVAAFSGCIQQHSLSLYCGG